MYEGAPPLAAFTDFEISEAAQKSLTSYTALYKDADTRRDELIGKIRDNNVELALLLLEVFDILKIPDSKFDIFVEGAGAAYNLLEAQSSDNNTTLPKLQPETAEFYCKETLALRHDKRLSLTSNSMYRVFSLENFRECLLDYMRLTDTNKYRTNVGAFLLGGFAVVEALMLQAYHDTLIARGSHDPEYIASPFRVRRAMTEHLSPEGNLVFDKLLATYTADSSPHRN